jgi:hypothetical protein
MKKQDKGTVKKECQTCNIKFISFLSDKRKFCSRKCFEKRRTYTACRGCGIKFYISGEPNMKYHNRECFDKNGNKGTFKKEHKINQNRVHSDQTKNKMSLKHRINRSSIICGTIQFPNFNPKACQIIEEYGKQNKYNFQHALNGGEFYIKELGYWVDGYDKIKNVVVEYQEKHHLTPKWIEKDKKRKEEIIKFLKCKFIYVYYNNKIEIWE